MRAQTSDVLGHPRYRSQFLHFANSERGYFAEAVWNFLQYVKRVMYDARHKAEGAVPDAHWTWNFPLDAWGHCEEWVFPGPVPMQLSRNEARLLHNGCVHRFRALYRQLCGHRGKDPSIHERDGHVVQHELLAQGQGWPCPLVDDDWEDLEESDSDAPISPQNYAQKDSDNDEELDSDWEDDVVITV